MKAITENRGKEKKDIKYLYKSLSATIITHKMFAMQFVNKFQSVCVRSAAVSVTVNSWNVLTWWLLAAAVTVASVDSISHCEWAPLMCLPLFWALAWERAVPPFLWCRLWFLPPRFGRATFLLPTAAVVSSINWFSTLSISTFRVASVSFCLSSSATKAKSEKQKTTTISLKFDKMDKIYDMWFIIDGCSQSNMLESREFLWHS